MASGDASCTWFSELVEALRREWKPDMPWEEIIALRDRLDSMLQEIRLSRGIRPPTMWCPVCNQRTHFSKFTAAPGRDPEGHRRGDG